MKNKLVQIFNALKTIETKGDSTITMADCLRALVEIVNSLPDENKQEVDSNEY